MCDASFPDKGVEGQASLLQAVYFHIERRYNGTTAQTRNCKAINRSSAYALPEFMGIFQAGEVFATIVCNKQVMCEVFL